MLFLPQALRAPLEASTNCSTNNSLVTGLRDSPLGNGDTFRRRMGKKVSEICQLSPLIHGRTDIYQTMYLVWTTVAPCSLPHETVLRKLLPPLLYLWLHYCISWRLRVKMFAHTWRWTNSVLNITYYVGQVYILVHTEAGKLGTETIVRIPGRTAVLLLPGGSDLRRPLTASFLYWQDEM